MTSLDMFSKLRPPDCVRIKVKLNSPSQNSSPKSSTSSSKSSSSSDNKSKKFCVDPQITSFEILKSLISEAFSIKSDFTFSYLNRESSDKDKYIIIWNDWDLDAAFMTSSEPYLCLLIDIDIKFADDGFEDWDVISAIDLPKNYNIMNVDEGRSLIATWSSGAADKAVSVFQKMLNGLSISDPHVNTHHEIPTKWKKPIDEAELRNFLDSDGRLVQLTELRQRVFEGGVHENLRKKVWMFLLNIFPISLSTQQRATYLDNLCHQYESLKAMWFDKEYIVNDPDVQVIAHKIQKDVARTDRSLPFYAGDNNEHVTALFNILLTYSLTHSSVAYAQGMSDLLSPLLYVFRNEAHAYVCFCSLMKRVKANFSIYSDSMEMKMKLLQMLVKQHDVQLWEYLERVGADQFVYAYRWLLLECKREFSFQDSLRVMEIMWSTVGVSESGCGIAVADLYEDDTMKGEHDAKESMSDSNNNPVASETKCDYCLRNERRRSADSNCKSSYRVFEGLRTRKEDRDNNDEDDDVFLCADDEADSCCDLNSAEFDAESQQQTVFSKEDFYAKLIGKASATQTTKSLSETHLKRNNFSALNLVNLFERSHSLTDTLKVATCAEVPSCQQKRNSAPVSCSCSCSNINANGNGCHLSGETALSKKPVDSGYVSDNKASSTKSITADVHDASSQEDLVYLLAKVDNPFLLFLCLTLFIESREHILRRQMDCNDIACYFDKMVRKHSCKSVLNRARTLFTKSYLSKANVFNYIQQLMIIQNSP